VAVKSTNTKGKSNFGGVLISDLTEKAVILRRSVLLKTIAMKGLFSVASHCVTTDSILVGCNLFGPVLFTERGDSVFHYLYCFTDVFPQ